LTPLHVGVGRYPGLVDLPVARDSFGLPYIPGSSLKGAVKSYCLAVAESRSLGVDCEKVYGWDLRLSPVPSEPWISPVLFTDALLLFYPVRVETEEGVEFAYATSRLQLERVAGVAGAWDGLGRLLDGDGGLGDREVYSVNGLSVEESRLRVVKYFDGVFREGVGAARSLARHIYVFEDQGDFVRIVEAGLIRHTRVRLDYKRKTVESGALWTEEYVSDGAVFAFSNIFRGSKHMDAAEACNEHHRVLECAGYTLWVGGKESVGKGLLRLVCVAGDCRGE